MHLELLFGESVGIPRAGDVHISDECTKSNAAPAGAAFDLKKSEALYDSSQ